MLMNFSDFCKKIQQILETELPSGTSVLNSGHKIAKDVHIGRTAFMDKIGVDSELDYKQQCIHDKQIMFHAHIGMNTWQDTAEALTELYRSAEESGYKVDRRQILVPSPIKELGIYEVPVKLHSDVLAKVRVWVVKM